MIRLNIPNVHSKTKIIKKTQVECIFKKNSILKIVIL